jgi:UDP-N-acetylglucosamine 1-carboxyvinyltransferase
MAKFLINGNKPLGGEVSVSGAKNAALKVFAATLAIDGPSVIANVPEIEDIHRIVEIIKDLGAKISKKGSEYTVDPSTINKTEVNPKLHQKLRSSILIAGPILLKKGEVTFSEPGGRLAHLPAAPGLKAASEPMGGAGRVPPQSRK